MLTYISGKITGLPMVEVIEKFKAAATYLESKGEEVINPLEISPYAEDKTWNDYMLEDIAALMVCDAIYMLKDWGQSKGARIEYQLAKELGLQILFEGEETT